MAIVVHRRSAIRPRRSSSSTSPPAPAPALPPLPAPIIDAAILVEGEARLIRSPTADAAGRGAAEARGQSGLYLASARSRKLLRYISPPPPGAPEMSKADIAAAKAGQAAPGHERPAFLSHQHLDRLEFAGMVGNAGQCLRDGIPAVPHHAAIARRRRRRPGAALQEARAIYGEKHPNVIQTKAQLEAVEARIREQEGLKSDEVTPPPGHSFLRARTRLAAFRSQPGRASGHGRRRIAAGGRRADAAPGAQKYQPAHRAQRCRRDGHALRRHDPKAHSDRALRRPKAGAARGVPLALPDGGAGRTEGWKAPMSC